MSKLVALPEEQVHKSAQILLGFLSDENVSVPGNLLEGVLSGKSLLRGILQGNLVVAQRVEQTPAPPTEEPAEEETAPAETE